MAKPKPASKLELWINTDTGMWLVTDLAEYNMNKPLARADVMEQLMSCIQEHLPQE